SIGFLPPPKKSRSQPSGRCFAGIPVHPRPTAAAVFPLGPSQLRAASRPRLFEAIACAEALIKKSGPGAAVAFLGNGSGMSPKMVRYALSWGAGTHFDELGTIGKFGFGA